MKVSNFDNTLQKVLKKILLVIIGSGLISNALYIYGLAYYEGYIESLGFEYSFFPINWEDTLLWTYFASREIGASTVTFWTKFTAPVILLILAVVYFIARFWMAINTLDSSREKKNTQKSTLLARFLVKIRKAHPSVFSVLYPPIRWFLVMEQSIWAFLASYFVLIILFFIPVFIFIWVYFPLIGLNHGEKVGSQRLEQYNQELCGDEYDYWNKCQTLTTSHLKNEKLPSTLSGRVISKNGNLIALLTKDGPVTVTMPPLFYQKTEKNMCFNRGCKNDDKAHNKSIHPTADESAD